jgi:PAS domain S-box-containing protein
MSALYSVPPGRSNAPPGDGALQARVHALEQELQALRAENAQLRNRPAAPDASSRPLPLSSALSAGPASAHAAQIEYEALFAALASVFPIGIFRTNEIGLLTHVDDSLLRIFDLPAEDFPQMGWLRLVHPDDLERVQRYWNQGILCAESLSVEFRLLRPSGGLAHLLVRNVPRPGGEGRAQGHLGFVQDITSLRELQADARIKEELNRQIIASSPDCTKVLDLQGHVLQMTAQGCRLVDVDDFEQVRGSDWTTWWEADSGGLARAAVDSASRGDSAVRRPATPQRHASGGHPGLAHPQCTGPAGDAVGGLARHRRTAQQQEQIRLLNTQLESRVRCTEELAQTSERLRHT